MAQFGVLSVSVGDVLSRNGRRWLVVAGRVVPPASGRGAADVAFELEANDGEHGVLTRRIRVCVLHPLLRSPEWHRCTAEEAEGFALIPDLPVHLLGDWEALPLGSL